MKTLKEQLTSINESVKIIDEERDYVCIHDSNIAKKDFLVVNVPMGYVQLMNKSMLELSAEDELALDDEDLNAILKLKYGEIYKMQDTFFVKI